MKKERVNLAVVANKCACHLVKHLQMGFLIIAGNNFVYLSLVRFQCQPGGFPPNQADPRLRAFLLQTSPPKQEIIVGRNKILRCFYPRNKCIFSFKY